MYKIISVFCILIYGCNHSYNIKRADHIMPAPIGNWSHSGVVTLWIHPNTTKENRHCFMKASGELERETRSNLFEVQYMNEKDVERYEIYGMVSNNGTVLIQGVPMRNAVATTLTTLDRYGKIIFAEVNFNSNLTIRQCRHELGHVLGLQDNFKGHESLLMTPNVNSVPSLRLDPETASFGTGNRLLPEEIEWITKSYMPNSVH